MSKNAISTKETNFQMQKNNDFAVYLKKYKYNEIASFFKMSNKDLHAIFKDKSEIIIS
jgi:hypothetical protein